MKENSQTTADEHKNNISEAVVAQEERGESLQPNRGTGHWALLNDEWENIKNYIC